MTNWTRAACRDADPELFFPASEDTRKVVVARQVSAAKTVCTSCPVWSECLTFAVETGQEFGVWGGLTTPERRRLARGDGEGTPPRQSDAA